MRIYRPKWMDIILKIDGKSPKSLVCRKSDAFYPNAEFIFHEMEEKKWITLGTQKDKRCKIYKLTPQGEQIREICIILKNEIFVNTDK